MREREGEEEGPMKEGESLSKRVEEDNLSLSLAIIWILKPAYSAAT